MVFSHGGRFVDDKLNPTMQLAKGGALAPLKWIVEAVNTHRIVAPAAVTTGELTGLKAFGGGVHALAVLAENRLRMLNDPKQSQVAGKIKLALMPRGAEGSHATVGWIRFYGLTKHAASRFQAGRRGGGVHRVVRRQGQGRVQVPEDHVHGPLRRLRGEAALRRSRDQELRQGVCRPDLVGKQFDLARKKDVMTAWFGEWNESNGKAWQSAILKKETPEAALKKSADEWTKLKKQHAG